MALATGRRDGAGRTGLLRVGVVTAHTSNQAYFAPIFFCSIDTERHSPSVAATAAKPRQVAAQRTAPVAPRGWITRTR